MKRMVCQIQLQYVCSERSTFLLNISPARTPQQRVLDEHLSVMGMIGSATRYTDLEGTRFIRFQGEGKVTIVSGFTVDIAHVHQERESLLECAPQEIPTDAMRFVLPSRYCESDKMHDFARQQFGSLAAGYGRIEQIARWVEQNIAFEPGSTNSLSSAMDVLTARRGVCRDFAHLMIALCRALNVPARFATGMDYGADPILGPLDFHAYVEVLLGDRWYIFDPTGIATPSGLIRLGTGRDAADVAFATIFGSLASEAPVIEIRAIQDANSGLDLPERNTQPISTSGLFTGCPVSVSDAGTESGVN